ncbi:hypothetical protein SynSYN20_03293 [Synechococcus sp. SYN20]|nr:hypothetical protein SynSYN20_03293 [Synechococcus sp. SYN20]
MHGLFKNHTFHKKSRRPKRNNSKPKFASKETLQEAIDTSQRMTDLDKKVLEQILEFTTNTQTLN